MVRADGEDRFSGCRSSVTGDAATFEGMLFDLKKPIEYYVEADGVRSPTYKMTVVELPAVANLELEYMYPGLHGPAAAEGRVGRRRRGAARHRSARAR